MEIVVTGRHTQVKQRFRDVVETKMNRVTAPYSEERREATRRYARENSTTNLLK